jgi:SMODS and SLOG-associating 2TM effector domain 1/Protein of unknown function (DUF4231)
MTCGCHHQFMGDARTRDLVASVWVDQSVWSQTADLLRARIDRLRIVMLGLAVTSAFLTTLAAEVATLSTRVGQVLAVAAGIAVGSVPLIRARLGRDALSRWARARAVPEELKAEVYRFLAGVAPFRGADRQAVLADRTRRVRAEVNDLLVHTARVSPVPREVPAVRDVDTYVADRLLPQIHWYRGKAERLASRLAWSRQVEAMLSVLGVVLASIAATRTVDAAAAWVAVVTTLTAALSAHVSASRWEYQLVEYLRTAGELGRLHKGRIGAGPSDEASADRFVEDCKHVVSIQNDGWMAKWTADQH